MLIIVSVSVSVSAKCAAKYQYWIVLAIYPIGGTLVNRGWITRKTMKDGKGTVAEPLLKQQFCKSDTILATYFYCVKNLEPYS